MIFKQSAIAAILFFKMTANFSQAKHLQARTSHGLFLHSEAEGQIRMDISGHFSLLTHLALMQGSKVKFNIWKRFPGHDFL